MAERLFGLETEYAYALLDRAGQRIDPAQALGWLLDAARRLIHLPDLNSNGIFLANGARFYIDCGGHPEFAGPELANPWDAARYVKAGERILERLAADLARRHDAVAHACFFRQNVDYSGTGSTWGSHESYLHRNDPALFRRHLIPHLVSRLVYTGAGGFDSTYPGIRFTLSPRVPHLEADVSAESTRCRGVFHTKDESLSSSGYHRLHLLCSESLFSELGLFLRVGATAVIVAMIEAGLRPGEGLALPSPLQAMQVFAGDPRCQEVVLNARGQPMTASAIQRHYLLLAEAHLQSPFMPPWAEAVCRQWRQVIERLESGSPDSVATSLDWAIRFSVFDKFLRDQGYSWQSLQKWNVFAEEVVKLLPGANSRDKAPDLETLSSEDEIPKEMLSKLRPQLSQQGVSLNEYKEFRALRSRLFELDTRFGQLGDKGLFAQLDRAGVLRHQFPGVDNFEHAMECPPATGRANLRGNCVRRLGSANCSRSAYACDWAAVWDQSQHRVLDLSDPFARQEDWKTVALDSDSSLNPILTPRHRRMFELLTLSGALTR